MPTLQNAAAALGDLAALDLTGLGVGAVAQGRPTVLVDGGSNRVFVGDVLHVRVAGDAVALEVEVPSVVTTLEDELGRHWPNDFVRHYHFFPRAGRDAALRRYVCDAAEQARAVRHRSAWTGPARLRVKNVLLSACCCAFAARNDAAADDCLREIGYVNIPWRRVAAPPRAPRGYSAASRSIATRARPRARR